MFSPRRPAKVLVCPGAPVRKSVRAPRSLPLQPRRLEYQQETAATSHQPLVSPASQVMSAPETEIEMEETKKEEVAVTAYQTHNIVISPNSTSRVVSAPPVYNVCWTVNPAAERPRDIPVPCLDGEATPAQGDEEPQALDEDQPSAKRPKPSSS